MTLPSKLSPEQREAIRLAPAEVSQYALARMYGVSRGAIRRYRVDGAKEKSAAANKAWRKFKSFLKSAEPPKKRGRKKGEKKDFYMESIIEALGVMGVDAIEQKIDDNLSKLTKEKFVLEEKITECKKMQEALYRFLNPVPIVLSSPDLVIIENKEEYMSFVEMKNRMQECGFNNKRLALELNHRYSVRAIRSYREGTVPVPRQLADFLKGCPNLKERQWSR